jgi:predicted site-specific integrase-resolvase
MAEAKSETPGQTFAPRSVPRRIEIDGDEYLSVSEAAERLGAGRGTISARMKNGGYRTARKVHGFWFASTQEVMEAYARRPRWPNTVELEGVLYMKTTEVARVLGVSEVTIRHRSLDGAFRNVREIDGCYYVAEDEVRDKLLADPVPNRRRGRYPIAIPRVLEIDGQDYLSIPEAALRLGISPETARRRQNKGLYPSALQKGRHWFIAEADLGNGQ